MNIHIINSNLLSLLLFIISLNILKRFQLRIQRTGVCVHNFTLLDKVSTFHESCSYQLHNAIFKTVLIFTQVALFQSKKDVHGKITRYTYHFHLTACVNAQVHLRKALFKSGKSFCFVVSSPGGVGVWKPGHEAAQVMNLA